MAYIENCVRSVVDSIRRSGEQGEVLVVDGMSDDGTREVLTSLHFPELVLIDNIKKTTPHALNLGIAQSKGGIVSILGAHSVVQADFITKNIEAMSKFSEAACVGGIIINAYEDSVSASIGKAMSSPFGVGNARFRTGGKKGFVDTVAFGAYRREVFDQIGVFDSTLVRNQDDEFNFRLTEAGMKVLYDPEIVSNYFVRASFKKLQKQYDQYGYWKVFVNKKFGKITSIRQLAPIGFVLLLFMLLPLTVLAWLFPNFILASFAALSALLLLVYLIGMVWFGLKTKPKGFFEFMNVLYSFWSLHFYYGIGYLKGIWDFYILSKSPGIKAESLTR